MGNDDSLRPLFSFNGVTMNSRNVIWSWRRIKEKIKEKLRRWLKVFQKQLTKRHNSIHTHKPGDTARWSTLNVEKIDFLFPIHQTMDVSTNVPKYSASAPLRFGGDCYREPICAQLAVPYSQIAVDPQLSLVEDAEWFYLFYDMQTIYN